MNDMETQNTPPSTFNPDDWRTPGGSYFNAPVADTSTTATYVNAQGHKITVTLVNGKPTFPIPQGYVPEGEAAQAFNTPEIVEDNGPAHTQAGNDDPVKDISEWSMDDLEGVVKQQDMFDTMAKASLVMGGGAGTVAGLGIRAMGRASKDRALEEIEDRLDDPAYQGDFDRLTKLQKQLMEDTREDGDGRSPIGEGLFGGIRDAFRDIFGGGKSKEERKAQRTTQNDDNQSQNQGGLGGFTGLKDMFDGGGPGKSRHDV